ncbi:P1 family peptidase [Lutispora thermophila]|uniref:P1 family peptidase n=1 Tax=Lutispora thermophila TaxID=288966 RepID=UPI0009346E69|nr:P1 family peptidase [Lutispora thermophila]
MEYVNLTKIPGIKLGNAEDLIGGTGCTVVLCEKGGIAGVDVRGGAPGTRETDLLNPINMMDKVHCIMLAGGSAFGLDAVAGVMEYLESKGIGFDVGITKVPIVPAAVLFDLSVGDYRCRPDKAMGYRACINAENGGFSEGSVGAGTGATVGKILGMDKAMKGGLGSFCIKTGELYVGAVVAVNCFGDVVNPESGEILAGAYIPEENRFVNTELLIMESAKKDDNPFSGNTTIGCVITNARLSKAEVNKVASMAHNGYARSIRPVHTMYDGDTIFALSTGQIEADVNQVGVMAVKAVEQAVINAVKKATPLFGIRAYSEVFREIP